MFMSRDGWMDGWTIHSKLNRVLVFERNDAIDIAPLVLMIIG